jgi:hypothetical protein
MRPTASSPEGQDRQGPIETGRARREHAGEFWPDLEMHGTRALRNAGNQLPK